MTFNTNGTYNVVLNRNLWNYYYAIYEELFVSLRQQRAQHKFFMQVVGKCPFFGDPMVLETKGAVVNQTVISPYLPPQNVFIVGIYR
jgi:hypothetical protein